jgi:hypothetical protein
MAVEHCVRDPDVGMISMGTIGAKSFQANYGDGAVVRVSLSRSAYCFLLACNSDGSVQLMWPRAEAAPHDVDPNRPPPTVTSIESPPQPSARAGTPRKVKVLTLNDTVAGGMQAFVLVASDTPLPCFASWKAQHAALPWQRLPPEKGVYRSQGENLERLDHALRAPEEEWTPKIPNALADLCVWAKAPGVAAVQAMMFPVYPKKESP